MARETITERLASLEARIENGLSRRLDDFGQRMIGIDRRLDDFGQRMTGIDQRLDRFERRQWAQMLAILTVLASVIVTGVL